MERENNLNQPQPIPKQSISPQPPLVAAVPTQTEPICKLLGFGYLFKKTFSVYKNNFWTFLLISVIPFAVSFLLSRPFLLRLESGSSLGSLTLIILIYLTLIIISIWFSVSLLYTVKEWENKMSFGRALAKGWSNLGSYIWLSFLVAVIVAGGLILLIIPGIIFSVWFLLALYVLVDENKKGISALKRSKELISGYVTAYWGRVLLFSLIVYVVVVLFSVIAKFLPVFGYISTIINIVIAPLFVIFGFLVYENIKKTKENGCAKSPKEIKYVLISLLLLLIPIGIFASIILINVNSARTKANDAGVKGMMYSMRVVAEMAFDENNNSYSGLSCTKNYDFIQTCDAVRNFGGQEPTIYSSQTSYCAYVKLPSGNYFCIDNFGNVKDEHSFPGGTGYCDGITFNCP